MALLINGGPYRCNFSAYKNRLKEMKIKTLRIVDAYFSCTQADCTPAIVEAYNKFSDYKNAEFNTFTRCSFTNYNLHCAQVLIQSRPPAYGSVENIVVGLLACAKLKLEAHSGTKV